MTDQALSDLKVLDLTHYIAGPYCTKLLADYGAEVIKIEKPGDGDGSRKMGPFLGNKPHPEKSGLHLYLNTNKKGITLNLKSDTGRKIFRDLVKTVDIVVENFEPRVMAGLGLDYEALDQIRPGLIMTSISNFGQTGPYRDYKATELIAQAMGGILYLGGSPDREPVRQGLSQAQYMAGSAGAMGTLTVIYARGETGIGQHIDVSIMETNTYPVLSPLNVYASEGGVTGRLPGAGTIGAIGAAMPCKDGYCLPTPGLVTELGTYGRMMGIPELEQEEYQTLQGWILHLPEITEKVSEKVSDMGKFDLFELCQAWRFSCGAIMSIDEVANCPHLHERGYLVEIERPETGRITYPGAPFKLSETPWEIRHPAPLLGQHNEEVYCNTLGYARDELVKLHERGII